MTPEAIIAEARALGVTLTPDGDVLRARPVTALTAELREAIRAAKPAILALLRSQATTAGPPQPPARPDPAAGIGDLPPGVLTALRESGASFHVEVAGDFAALAVQPWSALSPQLQADAVRFGPVLAAVLMGAARSGGLS